jgi:excisionase family DNA binding protein
MDTQPTPDEMELIRGSIPEQATFNTTEAAEVLRCLPAQVRILISEGELRACQRIPGGQGSRLQIPREALVAYMAGSLR